MRLLTDLGEHGEDERRARSVARILADFDERVPAEKRAVLSTEDLYGENGLPG